MLFIALPTPVLARQTNETEAYKEAVVLDERQTALAKFNEIREVLGGEFKPLTINEALTEMAQTHATYMRFNNVFTSVEDSDLKFFRGRYPWDRAAYYKYDAAYIYEFIRKDLTNFGEGLQSLIEDPISRSFLLDPRYTDIGMGRDEGYFTFIIGGEHKHLSRLVNYPLKNRQKDDTAFHIPTVWHGDSKEALYALAEEKVGQVGMPITESYYGKQILRTEEESVILTNVDNNTVLDAVVLGAGKHFLLENTITVLPLKPYERNSKYQVQLTYILVTEDDAGNIKREKRSSFYHFYTDSGLAEGATSPYVTRANFTEALVKAEGYGLIEPLAIRFTDVSINNTMSKFIYTANTYGLINGFPDGSFGPELNITKEQAYTILIKAYEKQQRTVNLTFLDTRAFDSTYEDREDISDWALTYIKKAAKIGIVYPGNTINPKAYLTEEEFSDILKRYKNVIDS